MGYIYGKPARDRRGAWWYWGKHPAGSKTPEIVDGFPSKDAAQEHAERHGYGRSPAGAEGSETIGGGHAALECGARELRPNRADEPRHRVASNSAVPLVGASPSSGILVEGSAVRRLV